MGGSARRASEPRAIAELKPRTVWRCSDRGACENMISARPFHPATYLTASNGQDDRDCKTRAEGRRHPLAMPLVYGAGSADAVVDSGHLTGPGDCPGVTDRRPLVAQRWPRRPLPPKPGRLGGEQFWRIACSLYKEGLRAVADLQEPPGKGRRLHHRRSVPADFIERQEPAWAHRTSPARFSWSDKGRGLRNPARCHGVRACATLVEWVKPGRTRLKLAPTPDRNAWPFRRSRWYLSAQLGSAAVAVGICLVVRASPDEPCRKSAWLFHQMGLAGRALVLVRKRCV